MRQGHQPILLFLKNPHYLSITMHSRTDGSWLAEFPAIEGCAAEGNSRDGALLNLAKTMQTLLQEHYD